jgi:CHASE1-domain containing sensor protein
MTTTLLVSLLAAGLALALARENRLRRAFQDLVTRLLDRIRQQSAFTQPSIRTSNQRTP